MASIRKLYVMKCKRCHKPATHAVDTLNNLVVGGYCYKHARAVLAKEQAKEDSGKIEPPRPEMTLDDLRKLFVLCPSEVTK